MQTRCVLTLSVLGLCLATPRIGGAETEPSIAPEAVEFFETRIRPVLVERCYECHSANAKEVQGGLMLDNRAAIERGGESGKALIGDDAKASRLLVAMRYNDESLQMPPTGKLPDKVISDFERWVNIGAPDPRDGPVPPPPNSIEARARKHWAFTPPQLPETPAVEDTNLVATDIDRFVWARLRQSDLTPSLPADAHTRVRRLYGDLIGLPPTFEVTQAFKAEPSAAAYEKLVDRLLDSEHFGERWARHWLDVARFGDTKGYVFQEDRNYPHAYRYRDWVIQALNDDLPYDQFLQYQLAADRLVDDSNRAHLAAMGFLTLGRRFLNNTHDLIDDRIDVVFRGTMALTVGCTRCHDHKYDPLSMQDYYSSYGVFLSSREQQDDGLPLRLVDKDKPVNVRIFVRGNPSNRGEVAPRQFLSFFQSGEVKPFASGSGRLELAEAITSRSNPLTARVFVNRVWAHLFGEGLVRTPSDFGLRSDPPAHQALLDHLAVTFMEDGWSIKRLIRRIVLSSTYQQQSESRADAAAKDPENLLLWRANRRRLDFEAMRDSLLSVSGTLDSTVLGPSVRIDVADPSKRRTLYAFIDRQNLPGIFRTFDFASPDTHSPKRPNTTVPQQALYLMNNRLAQSIAEAMVSRLTGQVKTAAKIRQFYRFVYAREPTEEELAVGTNFIEASDGSDADSSIRDPWQFGYGSFAAGSDEAVTFHPLPHFTGDAWQGGPDRPDPKLGWVILNAKGGHAGDDESHSAIRRWTAAEEGTVIVSGKLEHPSEHGDGVRSRIVAARGGVLGEWTAKQQTLDTRTEPVKVQPGDTIDFITDCRTNQSHDTFHWSATIRMAKPKRREWKSETGFHGPLPELLDVWARYAQTLLLTNEFMFLD
ncbi:MAG: cytochrome C [Planctomycetaceae bacterium]|nr:cytochrome C [Planctomycetaceae bacterium]